MRCVKGLSKGIFRSIAFALLLALVLTVAGIAIVKADDSTWTQTSQTDFEAGTLFQADTTTSLGDVKLVSEGDDIYASQGRNSSSLMSSINDCGSTATITQVSWGETLNGQTITMQIWSDDDASMSSPGSWETVTNGDTSISTPPNRYIQYKATLSTSDTSVTPVLHDVTINYTTSTPPHPSVGGDIYYPITNFEVIAPWFISVRLIIIMIFPLAIAGGVWHLRRRQVQVKGKN